MNTVFNKKLMIFGSAKHKNIKNLGWRILQKHVQKI